MSFHLFFNFLHNQKLPKFKISTSHSLLLNMESQQNKKSRAYNDKRIYCLRDELNESHSHLKKISNDKLVKLLNDQKCFYEKFDSGFDKFVFVKPKVSEPQDACLDKGKKNVIVMSM
jgi:hypothetical protein